TFIEDGSLVANNKTHSATGRGPVQIDNGTLAGRGIIGGAVTVGDGAGGVAQISPGGRGARNTGTLTIHQSVTFAADGAYVFQVDSDITQSDTLSAAGVTINSGAQFTATDLGTSSLPVGTAFTVLHNTGATPINGTFSNLPDGATITIGSNDFQANYEGG